ncbi:MAG: putative molybdenum carrier protein [Verrucomicrobia bacterium]|nr:putative molybdenum carrier protein [Verrucomicrobiota bacterium]
MTQTPHRSRKARPASPGLITAIEIWSGGQTGVDRAALDFALAHGLPHGGWCPRGRRAEDGVIPERYRLRETRTDAYAERTRLNVRDTDATAIFASRRVLSGGTRLTREFARELGRPVMVITVRSDVRGAAVRLRAFLRRHHVRRLNLAGPRASEAAGLAVFVSVVLERALAGLAPRRIK